MNVPILSLININKRISSKFKLSNINMDFYPGEVCGIIGENGSGKSSLMKIISGIYKPDSGIIEFESNHVEFPNVFESKKKGIYYVPQEINLFDNLTVAENIFIDVKSHLYAPYDIVKMNNIYHLTEEIFNELNVDIDPFMYVKDMELSKKQILSFVKAYISDAKFIIFDEPASTLTDLENDILFDIINKLKANNCSIVLISHKIDRIKKISDKIAVLKNGSIIKKGESKDYSSEKIIQVLSESKNPIKYPKLYFENDDVILSVENLNYKNILKSINFKLQKQEIIGIIGNSNSRKDTLISILFGLIKPDSGKIFLDGEKIEINHPSDAMLKGITLVPEDKIEFAIFNNFNLINNLSISSLKRFSKNQILDNYIMENVAENYIYKLRITPGNPEDKIIYYSGGNQQKVTFAKSIMQLAKIYLLDEPTRGIDVVSKNDVYNIINNLLISGSSVILFSTDFDEILGMCDRILVLSDGEIVALLDAHDTNKEELIYYLTL
ncbi:sugar ABC transporter ATP-binding protein [Paratissierella segnis]|jgi:ribose transport system ATP-binding protein|uniref:Autoinducer 2 import ATP-binding protein LsrA n=1 Tax=Paratissierella segnis TaxID=2763679 RepID=A0A926EWP9_9FIRM|nr:sugar ABC transporter ATP-binding protein [Paratissierella segnis]MBC8588981.1 sugar ABC transporter ATP-binding protein [Paratissierella segnis]